MSDPTSTTTAFERARRYQELSKAILKATAEAPTLDADAPPYESLFGRLNLGQQSEELADIAGFYRAFGLKAPEKERVDHLAVELEFMSFLALKEAWAVCNGEPERALEVRAAQTKFLADHLARWTPVFAARFEARDAALAGSLRDWVAQDARELGAEVDPIRTTDVRAGYDVNEPMECGGGSCNVFF